MVDETSFVKVFVVLFGVSLCLGKDSGKCGEYTLEDASVNLETAVSIFQNCLITQVENFRQIIVSNSCDSSHLEIKDCETDIVDAITNCKSEDRDYFPPALFNLINGYLDTICANATTYKHYILLDHRTCFPSLSTAVACYNKFRYFNSSVTATQHEMCQDQLDVKECLFLHINNTCANDTAFWENVNRTIIELNFPCSASSKSFIVILYFVILFINVL